MNRIRLLWPLACVAAALALGSCARGLQRYPPAIDYDQLELRMGAIMEERSRLPAARRDEHAELLELMERQLAQVRREQQVQRQRRIEFLERANREQLERSRAFEAGYEATPQERAAWRARRYPNREEGLELMRRSEQVAESQ